QIMLDSLDSLINCCGPHPPQLFRCLVQRSLLQSICRLHLPPQLFRCLVRCQEDSRSQARLVQGLQPPRRCSLGPPPIFRRHFPYKKGLEIDPNNEALKSGLANAQSVAATSNKPKSAPSASPFGDAFSESEMWSKLAVDPTTRAYLQQPNFVKMMQEIQKNPTNFSLYLKDQRLCRRLVFC
ncbi:hypothetical protein Ancab_008552, partial [Ancistrocladus abbreviatus]